MYPEMDTGRFLETWQVLEPILNQLAYPGNTRSYVEILELPLLRRKDGVITRTTNRNALLNSLEKLTFSVLCKCPKRHCKPSEGRGAFSVVN